MLNQHEAVFSYTIPYIATSDFEMDELFVSEKTYEKFLHATKKMPVHLLSGQLHPIAASYGAVTTSLFDTEKAIIIIGIDDLNEYTSELIDITVAAELEKVIQHERDDFYRYLYAETTEDYIKTFIDDAQQTIAEIPIAKRLIKQGYRINKREQLIAKDLLANSYHFKSIRHVSPLQNEQALFLLFKIVYLYFVDEPLFSQYKNELQRYYPSLILHVVTIIKLIKKINISTAKGQQRALNKIFNHYKYEPLVKKIMIDEVEVFRLPEEIMKDKNL